MLRLVHVVDDTPPAYIATDAPSAVALHFPLAEYKKTLLEAGENLLRTRATTAREAGVNVDTKLITVTMLGERIYEVIEEQSKQWPANLIVVGTEGRRGFQRLMIGSVAEGLVRISTKPVLLIRGARKKEVVVKQRHGRGNKVTGGKRRDRARAMGDALYTGC